jgi:membrane protein
MARLRDAGTVIRKIGPVEFVRRVLQQVDEDNLFVWASSLSYSWVLALFPFLVFLLSLIPYLPEGHKEDARQQIQNVINQFPATVKTTIDSVVQRLMHEEQKGLLTVGIAVTIWAASGGMAATTAALDKAWDVEVRRNFFKRRVFAILLTMIVSFLLALILFLLPIGTIVINWFIGHASFNENWLALILLNTVRWTIAVMVMFLVLEVVYFFGPNIKQRWRWVTPGSLFCAVSWIILGLGFRFYVDRFGKYNETYGAVGGAAVLMLIFYFDALCLLVGAEINSEIDFEILGVQRGTQDFTRRVTATKPEAPAGVSPSSS